MLKYFEEKIKEVQWKRMMVQRVVVETEFVWVRVRGSFFS
jgi:hypothetical protein